MSEVEEFEEIYRDLVHDVESSSYSNFSTRLKDWFNLLDETPQIHHTIEGLSPDFDFDSWYGAGLESASSMVGSARLNWSEDRNYRLGQYLKLFRFLSNDEDAYVGFCSNFAWAGPKLNDGIIKIIDDYYRPFQRDLLRKLIKEWKSEAINEAPASDRVVLFHDNFEDISDLRTKISDIESYVRNITSNSLRSDPDYLRNVAEISATSTILQADSARVSIISKLTLPALKWLGEKAAGQAIALTVTAALVLIAKIFGLKILGI